MGLEIQFFDKFSASQNGVPCGHLQPLTKKLLLLLSLKQGITIESDRLIDRLWPNLPRTNGRKQLIIQIGHLREAFKDKHRPAMGKPSKIILTRYSGYKLADNKSVVIDVVSFRRHLEEAKTLKDEGSIEQAAHEYRKAAKLYKGKLLDFDIDQDDIWICQLRDQFHADYLQCLMEATKIFFELADYELAIQDCREIYLLDHTRQDFLRIEMACLYQNALPDSALGAFDAFIEIGGNPDEETRKFRDDILNGDLLKRPSEAPESYEVKIPIIFRTHELNTALGHLNEALRGNGRLLFLVGQAGVGKSWLAQQVIQCGCNPIYNESVAGVISNIQGQCQVFRSSCGEQKAKAPLHPFKEFASTILQKDEDNHYDLTQLEISILNNLIPGLSDSRFSNETLYPLATVEQEDIRLWGVFDKLLLAYERLVGPIILLFEDAHWLDEDSIKYITHLTSAIHNRRIFILCTLRMEESGTAIKNVIDQAVSGNNADTLFYLKLERFSEEDFNQLVQSSISSQRHREELGDYLFRESEGLALFYVIMWHLLVADHKLKYLGNGRWDVGFSSIDDLSTLMPNRIKDIIKFKLGHLAEESKPVLQLLSVIGNWSAPEIFVQVWELYCAEQEVGIDDAAMRDQQLRYLIDRGVIIQKGETIGFWHDRYRECVYDDILLTQKSQFHGLVAQALTSLQHKLHITQSEIIHHWVKAKQFEIAWPLVLPALKDAITNNRRHTVYQLSDDIELIKDHLDLKDNWLADHFEDWVSRLIEVVDFLHTVGDTVLQSSKVQELHKHFSKIKNPNLKLKTHLVMAQFCLAATDYKEARLHANEAYNLAQQIDDKLSESLACVSIAEYHRLFESDYDKAIYYLSIAQDIQQQAKAESAYSETLSCIAQIKWDMGCYGEAEEKFKQAVEIQTRLDDLSKESLARGRLGSLYWSMNQYQKSLKNFERMLEICRQVGDRRGEGQVLADIALLYLFQGKLESAITNHQEALEIIKDTKNKRVETIVSNNMGFNWLMLGDYDVARDCIEQSLSSANDIGWDKGQALALGNLGVYYHRIKDYSSALAHFEKALQIHESQGNQWQIAEVYVGIAEVYIEQDQIEPAETKLDLAFGIKAELKATKDLILILCLQAVVQSRLGNSNQAKELILRANEMLATAGSIIRAHEIRFRQFQALSSINESSDAIEALKGAYNDLKKMADEIENEALQSSFLSVPLHKEITAALFDHYETLLFDPVRVSQLFRDIRWKRGIFCPRCQTENPVVWEKPHNHIYRYKCKGCSKTFNDLTGTRFENSKINFEQIIKALFLMNMNLLTGPIALRKIIDISNSKAKNKFEELVNALDDDLVKDMIQHVGCIY